jgi:hypothetical protein
VGGNSVGWNDIVGYSVGAYVGSHDGSADQSGEWPR